MGGIEELLDAATPQGRANVCARSLGLDVSAGLTVGAVSLLRLAEATPRQSSHVAKHLHASVSADLDGLVVEWYFDDLVCFLPGARERELEGVLSSWLADPQSGVLQAVAGIGSVGVGVSAIRRAHEEALRVVDLLAEAPFLPQALCFARALPYFPLRDDPAYADEIIRRSVEPLVGTPLFDALVHLLGAGSLAQAAGPAGSSKSTLSRRRKEIQQVIDLDLDDAWDLHLAWLGVCAVRLRYSRADRDRMEAAGVAPPWAQASGVLGVSRKEVDADEGPPQYRAEVARRRAPHVLQVRRRALRRRVRRARSGAEPIMDLLDQAVERVEGAKSVHEDGPVEAELERTRDQVADAYHKFRRGLGALLPLSLPLRVRSRIARGRDDLGFSGALGGTRVVESLSGLIAAAVVVGALSGGALHGSPRFDVRGRPADRSLHSASFNRADMRDAVGTTRERSAKVSASIPAPTHAPVGATAGVGVQKAERIAVGHAVSAEFGGEHYPVADGPILWVPCGPEPARRAACDSYGQVADEAGR